ncbi:copper resistance protein CopC [Streptomyces sp. NBC_00365]|uniref:copper resistance CopC/CopD family protein n=1 Tax=Streptomyces sp. NBC_00365 TaxID=2975726 RepID=UPI00224D10F3|nr:copper resistance protein CopC [Streptomyces sp. NBC_00365]MCX5091399.1 copper resistance protein CopC [Streptomyces sp. NBC_00365]
MTQTIAPHAPATTTGGVAFRVRALLLLLLAVAGAVLAGATPASAHAALTGSTPQQGAVVNQAPTQVSLTFSERVALSDGSVRVLDPKGKRVDTGKAVDLGGTTYGVKLHSGLPDGTFTVTYQVVSADSHPVSGAFTFSIGAPSQTSVALSDPAVGGGVVGALYGIGRYVSYAGFILLVGGAAFVLTCWKRGAGVRPVQRLVVSGWLALTGATLALLLLRGSYVGSGKVGDIFDLTLLGQVLQTKAGAALVSRLLLLAAGALFIAVLFGAYARRDEAHTSDEAEATDKGALSGEGEREVSDEGDADADADADVDVERKDLAFGLAIGGTVVAAGLAASWAMAEHASTGIQPGLAMPVDVLHLLAVAVWLGGLSTLLVALFRAPAEAQIEAATVRRFSRVAFGSVTVLAATGIYQSWRQVGSWSALTGTSYGQLLLVKVGLVAVLVGIGWTSRRWTAQLFEAPEAEAMVTAGATAGATAYAGQRTKQPTKVPANSRNSSSKDSTSGSSTSGGSTSGNPRRAAQLARQQAAVATARQKRLRDADPARAGLRRSVLAEAGIAVVLLAVTTVLTSTEPGRTEEAAQQSTTSSSQRSGSLSLKLPFDTGGEDGKGTAEVTLDPARVGGNEMHVFVKRPNGKAFDVPEVKVAFTLEAKKIGPLPVTPDRIATGHWSAIGVQIPMAGDWEIAVTVRTSDIDQTTVTKNAKIG